MEEAAAERVRLEEELESQRTERQHEHDAAERLEETEAKGRLRIEALESAQKDLDLQV